MSDVRASVLIDLAGNLEQRALRYQRALGRVGTEGSRSMRIINSAARSSFGVLDKLANRWTGIFGAAGIGLAVKSVGDLQLEFTRLGVQAGKSDEEIARLKDRIFEVSQENDIRIDPQQALEAINAIVEKTGDLDFAEEQMRNIGYAIQASGASGQVIGDMFAEFQKFGITGSEAVMRVFDTLNQQGKMGAFTIENVAAMSPRLINSYGALGAAGEDAWRELGAVMQVIRQGTGSSEQATTSMEALLRVLGDAKKLEALAEGGIEVFKPGTGEGGLKEIRPINELLKEIIERAKGDRTVIQSVLGDSEAVRAFNAALSEFGRTGALESLDKFMAVQADGTQTMEDSERVAQTLNSALTNLNTAYTQFKDDNLAAPVERLAEALNSLGPETLQRWMEAATYVAAIGGTYWAAGKLLQKKPPIAPPATVGGAQTQPLKVVQSVLVTNWPAKLLGNYDGPNRPNYRGSTYRPGMVQSVFVTNWPPGMWRSTSRTTNKTTPGAIVPDSKSVGTNASTKGGYWLNKMQGYKLPGVLMILPAGMTAASIMTDGESSGDEKADAFIDLGSEASGMVAGAAIGTALAPGLGTLIGAIIGQLIGDYAGDKIVESRQESRVMVEIDVNGNASVSKLSADGEVEASVNTGSVFNGDFSDADYLDVGA